MHHGQVIGSALDGPPAAADSGRFVGSDASGCVQVQLDPDVARPRVALDAGWRSTVQPEGLGSAVLQAFGAATTERLMAFASADPRATEAGPTNPRPGGGATGALPTGTSGVELVHRAQNDLAEFRTRLAALSAATRTVSSSDQRVTVTVRGGSIVAVDSGRAWRETVGDQDLERHLDEALRAALSLIATTPQQALDGCPYLLALLATNPAALPFRLPETALPPSSAAQPAHSPSADLPAPADPDRSMWSPPAGCNPTSAPPAGRAARPAADPTNFDW